MSARDYYRFIAEDTLEAINRGYVLAGGELVDLTEHIKKSVEETRLYAPRCSLSTWAQDLPKDNTTSTYRCKTVILQMTALAAARLLANTDKSTSGRQKIGVLNFASAKKPGGGFMNGIQAQEESIARSSTLYPSLTSSAAENFYQLHRHDPDGGYYSHAMIYSPDVILLRDDAGAWVQPISVDVISSPSINANVVRRSLIGRFSTKTTVAAKIEKTMRERMARILFLFETWSVKHIVLGSFGTGVFGIDVGMIAWIWADLVGREDSRFGRSFDRVLFAIEDKKTFEMFEPAFEDRVSAGMSTQSVVSSL